ncbi:hypothetical protein [Streptomyces sp. NPDC048172]|uniref:DUF7144 family membrane protein n=1 Tax=Streptomyces sp. NPDC048172 TaxID=3365505 RepID=UPI003718BCF8
MTDQISGQSSPSSPERPTVTAPAPRSRPKPLAVGGIAFATWVMIMIGAYHVILGLAAIIDDDFYVLGRDYVYEFDITAWGWFQLISGAVVLAAGIALITGKMWARVVGIVVALLSAVENFFFIPYYPVWSVMIIALDVLVIWALVTYGPREAENL